MESEQAMEKNIIKKLLAWITVEDKRIRTERILICVGLFVLLIQIAATAILVVQLEKANMVPDDYKVLGYVLISICVVITGVTQRWKWPGIVTKVMAFILSMVMIAGSVYIQLTHQAISKVTDTTIKTTIVNVYVLADSDADDINGLLEKNEDALFGLMKTVGRDNTDEAIDKIEADCHTTLSLLEYDALAQLVGSLYDGTVNAIFLDTGYIGSIVEMEGFENFETDTKVISSMVKEVEVKEDQDETTDEIEEIPLIHSEDGHVIAIYISGVDIEGSPTACRNSDVNILCVMNMKTHQVLLLNTPRDYYVTMAWDGGVMDKLTHAGCHGVDCSVQTLRNLYGLQIDDYVKVNFSGFKRIIDSLGGVNVWSAYDFTSFHGNFHFNQGYNYMNGEQALGFCRERYAFGSGDNQRGRNQMEVVKAVIEKAQSTDMLKNYASVLDSVSSSMATSMTYDELAELIQYQLSENPTWDIQIYAVTGHGDNQYCYTLGAANYVMWPNEDAVEQAKTYLKGIYNDEYIKVQ